MHMNGNRRYAMQLFSPVAKVRQERHGARAVVLKASCALRYN